MHERLNLSMETTGKVMIDKDKLMNIGEHKTENEGYIYSMKIMILWNN